MSVADAILYCVALYPYTCTKKDELPLKPGDFVLVTKKADDGWWFGRLAISDKSGWFPSNFVHQPENQTMNIRNQEYNYVSQEADELNLSVGDIVIVLATQEDKGWFRGILNGKIGLFPANFVRPVKLAPQNVGRQTDTSLTPTQRRTSLATDHTDNPAKSGSKSKSNTGKNNDFLQLNSEDNKTIRAIVTFDYIAQEPDELTLRKGNIIQVVVKEDQGWWTGVDSSGKIGVFPFNFVRELPSKSHDARDDESSSIINRKNLNTKETVQLNNQQELQVGKVNLNTTELPLIDSKDSLKQTPNMDTISAIARLCEEIAQLGFDLRKWMKDETFAREKLQSEIMNLKQQISK